MMIKKEKRKTVVIIVLTALITLTLAAGTAVLLLRHDKVVLVSQKDYHRMKNISGRYSALYDIQNTVNRDGLKKVSHDKEMEAMYDALLKSLDDRYSVFMTKDELKKWDAYVDGVFYGIGIGLTTDTRHNAVIDKVYSKSPAKAAGLKRGDILLAVNGKTYPTLKGYTNAIRGKEGSKVTVRYRRGKKVKTVEMARSRVVNESVCGGVTKGNHGYIWISSFAENTADEFRTELNSLESRNVKGLIIDLRNNGGGYTDQAVKVADMLLPEGAITYMKDRSGNKKYFNSGESCTALRYVVLVNENTASSAEIVAAAIKDSGRAKLIGRRTYGKGVVQGEYRFKNGTGMRLTIMEYYSPKGHKINGKGIRPDLVVKAGKSRKHDVQLQKAIRVLSSD